MKQKSYTLHALTKGFFIFLTGVVNDRSHVVNPEQQGENDEESSIDTTSQSPGALGKLISAVLSSPGQIVSFSLLIKKNLFRRPVNNLCNKELMIQVVDELSLLHFGNVENFKIPSNNSKVCDHINNT